MIEPRREVSATPLAVHGGRLAGFTARGTDTPLLHDFSVCLNAFGPSQSVVDAIRASRVDEYPDPHSRHARAAAAAHWGRPTDEIAFGAGSAELIHAVCFAYLRANDDVCIATPAFGEYARAASLCGALPRLVHDEMTDSGSEPLAQFVKDILLRRPRLAFIASPVSPTGAPLARETLQRVANACRMSDSLLVLDQAYEAFSSEPLGTPALPGHPAVLHLRSLTKEHALAGIRAAFAFGPADIIEAVERVRVPWASSTAAQAAAVAALSDDATAHVARTIPLLRAEAARIAAEATHLGFCVHPSSAHFFIANVGDAAATQAALRRQHHTLVRDCASFGLPQWIRVAARTPRENDALIAALKSLGR